MHELTLAEHVIAIVENAVTKAGIKKVTRVRLSVGKLSHVESDTLLYCCKVVSRGSFIEGVHFEIDRPAGKAQCNKCGKVFSLDHLAQACPSCLGHDFQLLDGDQLKVAEIGFSE